MITVERLGSKGDAIITGGQKALHADRFLPGDVVELRHGEAILVTPSPHRITPFCAHFDACGGCKFQHWNETVYRDWKRARVMEALGHVGIETEVADVADAHGAGRRRATLHVRNINDVWRAGFMAQKSHSLCAIQHCPILTASLQDAANIAASFGPVLGACDVSLTASDTGLDVAVKAERKAVERRLSALSEILARWQLARLSVNGDIFAQMRQPAIVMSKAMVPLPSGAFLQPTVLGEQVLAAAVCEFLSKAKHIADLFCGVGTFALRLGEFARVSAFDSDKSAIHALQLAAKTTQGLKPLTAVVRNLFNAPVTPQELKAFDALVLDPPRAGAEAQCRAIAKSGISRLAYVSCDVQSFARDAQVLCQGGFTLRLVKPVDQFKWSAHIELVSVFSR